MRKFLILLVLLTVVGIGVIDHIIINGTFNAITEKIDAIETEYNGQITENLKQQAEDLHSYWHGKEHVLNMFVQFRDVEMLGKQIDMVKSMIQFDTNENLDIEISQMQNMVKTVQNVYAFNFYNLL